MKLEPYWWRWVLLPALGLFSIAAAFADEAAPMEKPLLKKGARLVVAGDITTYNCADSYPQLIELYLTVCRPDLDANVLNLGSRTTIDGLAAHLPLMMLPYKPDLITTCYGQEDGGASAFVPAKGQNYSKVLGASLDRLKAAGIAVIVGSPIAVDTHYYKYLLLPNTATPASNVADPAGVFNDTLAQFGELARAEAASRGVPFADVHSNLISVMKRAKAAMGDDYVVCGFDKAYPTITPTGNLVIAYTFLKEMGVTGDIGTITIDMKGPATASDGHKVLSSGNGQAEIESSRYPFCFTGDEKVSTGTRSILPFVAFNQELNRFTLVVKNLAGEKAKVTWGTESKDFTKKELESGINLAEAFVANNPFSASFKKINAAIATRQANAERIYTTMLNIDRLFGKDADGIALRDAVRQEFFQKLDKTHAEIQAMVVPLKHTLAVTAE